MRTQRFDPLATCTTLVHLVQERAAQQGDQLAYTFLTDGEVESAHLTYGELDRQARTIGAHLQAAGLSGERALLLYPPGLAFVAAFLGCQYAGVVPVPVSAPRLSRPDRLFLAVLADARATAVLTTAENLAELRQRNSLPDEVMQQVRWISTDNLDPALSDLWREPVISGDTLAFLQYTSGSTALPKGVMVSHTNLLANERMLQHAFPPGDGAVCVSWLPLYHDMGLIGGLLQPLCAGYRSVLMAPMAFLQRPMRWLQAISRYRGQISTGPNFAYELCARKATPQQIADLDLSSWQAAISGAEPVRWETLDRFAQTFAPCGFRAESLYPSFGLAEATLFVTGGRAGGQPRLVTAERQSIISCGQPGLGTTVRIVDPESQALCPDETVGEIWVKSPSIAKGYWERPAESAETFGAHLPDGEGPFMRTGDLGFMKAGELYVTGRLKDLIIIRGQNHYPQDIEWTVQGSHIALRQDSAAAFGLLEDGEERLVVVAEVERTHRKGNLEEVAIAVRTAVAEQHGLQTHAIVLLRPGGLPRTTSGKVRRSACRTGYQDESLDGLFALIRNRPVPDWGRQADADPVDLPS